MSEQDRLLVNSNDDFQVIPRSFWGRSRRWIEPGLFFYVLAFHIQKPLLQQYAVMRYGEDAGLNASSTIGKHSCDHGNTTTTSGVLQKQARSHAADFQTGLMLCETLPSFVMCLIYGSLSDRIGRKPIVILSVSSSFIEALFILFTIYFKLDLRVIYIGCFLNGLGGYFTSLQMSMMAIIADTTPSEKRYFRLGLIHSVVFMGSLCSSLLSGILISRIGFFFTYLSVSGSYFVALLYVVFVLKETRRRMHIDDEGIGYCANIFRYPIEALNSLIQPSPRRWKIILIFFTQLFNYMIFFGSGPIFTLYALGEPYCLSSEYVGYFLATRFACIGIGTPVALKALRFLPDYGMATVGLISTAATYVALILAETKTALFLAWLFSIGCGVQSAMYRAILSNNISANDQGKIFSLVSSVEIIFVFIGTYSFNAVYKTGNKLDHRELVFIYAIALIVLPLALTMAYGVGLHEEKKSLKKNNAQ